MNFGGLFGQFMGGGAPAQAPRPMVPTMGSAIQSMFAPKGPARPSPFAGQPGWGGMGGGMTSMFAGGGSAGPMQPGFKMPTTGQTSGGRMAGPGQFGGGMGIPVAPRGIGAGALSRTPGPSPLSGVVQRGFSGIFRQRGGA